MDKKAICAVILGCRPGDLMGFKDYGAFVAVLDPTGRKFIYTNEHLKEVDEGQSAIGIATKDEEKRVIEVGDLRLAAPAKPAKKVEQKTQKTQKAPLQSSGSLPKSPKSARKVENK